MKKSSRISNKKTKNVARKTASHFVLGTIAATAALPLAMTTVNADEAAAQPPPSRVNALVDLTMASHYLTPRGMDVVRQGVVFQPMVLTFFNVYKSDSFLNSATVVAGMWNCFATSKQPSSDSNGAKKTGWIETDPIAGLCFGLAKNFTLSVTYTAFSMQIDNIPFSQHLETKLAFNDSDYLKEFALHPYVIYWQELSGKAVANTDPNPSNSFYFDVGVSPGFTFKDFYDIKLEAPCRILMANSNFYGTGAGGTTFVSLYEFGLKASMPLKFMPQGYGHWSANIGFKRQGFDNPNLRATQGEAGATVVYGGISTFF
jgi:hypothetical protein